MLCGGHVMPQLNKSEAVRQRLRSLLQRLIAFANHALTDCEPLESKINVRWTALETSTPKLIVKTEIRFLAELVFPTSGPKVKEKLKQDLRTLKDFLGRLEDNRDRTQGSGTWHFTLTLWHTSVEKNLIAFDETWQRCKAKDQVKAKKQVRAKDQSKAKDQRPMQKSVFQPGLETHELSDESNDYSKGRLNGLRNGNKRFSAGVSVAHSREHSQMHTLGRNADTVRSHSQFFLNPSTLPTAKSISAEAFPAETIPTGTTSAANHESHSWGDLSRGPYSGVSPWQRPQLAQCIPPNAHKHHNLPTRDYGTFIGRERPLQQLLTFLSADHPTARISVTGIGGIGKTALILEAAHRCRTSDSQSLPGHEQLLAFDALIFASTKTQHFTPHGILPSYRHSRTLQDLFRVIAQTLKCPNVLAGDFEHQLENIYDLLSRQRTLLMIDNLEALHPENQQAVLSFLYELPAVVKVIVTSRIHLPMDEVIPLTGMNEPESLQFIQHQAQLKAVSLGAADRQSLYQHTCGTPAAIVYAMGQLAVGYRVPQVLPKLTLKTGDYCAYYLEGTVKSLQDQSAYALLMALSLFPASASREALIYIAQLSEAEAIESFVNLEQRSLITCQAGRYSMLPLTRDYVLANRQTHGLAGNPEDKERWLTWYKQWLRPYCHENWRAWHDYSLVDFEWDALQALVEWCIAAERYEDFGALWSGLKGYTHLRGYWNERLSWLEWWLQAAQKKGDRTTLMQALRDLGWTLTMMGQPQQLEMAKLYFSRAWESSQRGPLALQLDLAIEHVVLFLFQRSLAQVEPWLKTAETLLARLQQEVTALDDTVDYDRQQMRLTYYAAQFRYWQGEYAVAKSLYQDILRQAQRQPQTTKQQQAEVYSLNWLVDIALQENNLKEADRLLQQSWPVIQDRQDMRSQAFHQRSKAQLEKLRGNLAGAQHWSERAKTCFETLCMQPQVQEMQAWLRETDASTLCDR